MTPEQLIQLRFNLALQLGKEKSVAAMDEIFQWVIGPKKSIMPVTSFEVVK